MIQELIEELIQELIQELIHGDKLTLLSVDMIEIIDRVLAQDIANVAIVASTSRSQALNNPRRTKLSI